MLVLGPLVPDAELDRLLSLGLDYGAGPFRVQSWLFIVASNISWIAEIVLPAMLLYRPTRRLGVVGAVLFIFAIQSGARELYFGGLMVGFILLYWPGGALRRAYPLFLIAYLPFSKLFHIFAGLLNVALETLPPDVLTLEERERSPHTFSRRHIIAGDACTRCNRCENKCPANASGEALSPRAMNQRIKGQLREKYSVVNMIRMLRNQAVPEVTEDAFIQGEEAWMCTSCRACGEAQASISSSAFSRSDFNFSSNGASSCRARLDHRPVVSLRYWRVSSL